MNGAQSPVRRTLYWCEYVPCPTIGQTEREILHYPAMLSRIDVKVTDHLANERTFLAWVRTSISLLGFGVVIARLRFIEPLAGAVPSGAMSAARSTWVGLAFAMVGLVTLVFATWSYQRSRKAIDAGEYQSLGASLTAFSVIILLLGIFAVGYLVALVSR